MKQETVWIIWIMVKIWILVMAISIFTFGSYTAISKVLEYFDLKNNLIKEEMKLLSKNMASIKTEYDAKKLKDRIDLLDDAIIELAKSRDQDIKAFGQIISQLESTIKSMNSDKYIDNEDPNKTFDQTLVYIKDSNNNDFPIAHVLYNPFLDTEDKWTTRTYPIKFTSQIALGESKDRKDAYVQLWMENDDIEEYKGKKFPVNIKDVEWIESPPKDKRFMFNPRLSLGASIGTDIYPNLGVSLFSFGRTNRDIDWSFLRIGLGGNDNSLFTQLSPLEYNIGCHIPLVENLFCGPIIGYEMNLNEKTTELLYGVSLDIPF